MEITSAGEDSVRLKGKNVIILADPTPKSGPGDIAISLKKGGVSAVVPNVKLSITGAGEYEVGGVKITGVNTSSQMVFTGEIDGVRFVIGDAKALEEALPKLDETQVAIIKVSEGFNSQIIAGLGPRVGVLYGPQKDSALNELGKKDLISVLKYVVKNDALAPEKEEIVALGS